MLKSFQKNTGDLGNDADIMPGAGGIIVDINKNDVLSGRGGRINSHSGNVQFRALVNKHKHQYLSQQTKKLEKVKIANLIVQTIRNMDPPGRFLKEDSSSNHWIEIGDEKARKKAGQAMREKAELTRQELEEENTSRINHQLQQQAHYFSSNQANSTFQPRAEYQHLPIHVQKIHPSISMDSSPQEHIGLPSCNNYEFGSKGMDLRSNHYHNLATTDANWTSNAPPRNQAMHLGSVPGSSEEPRKKYAEFLKGNFEGMNRIKGGENVSMSVTSLEDVSSLSLFQGHENSITLSQEQNSQISSDWNQPLSTKDRRRMFVRNQSEQSSGRLPLEKDSDLISSENITSELMKASIQSFNASGPIRTHSQKDSEDVTMGESSLNRFLDVASDYNSISLLSLAPDINNPYCTEPSYNLNHSNPSTTRNYVNDYGSSLKEVNFNHDVNFESKRLMSEAALGSQSRHSSISSWLNNDMSNFLKHPSEQNNGISRVRQLSGTSYANESMRSIMSDLSENVSALDLAQDYRLTK